MKIDFYTSLLCNILFRNTAWVSFDGRKRQELCHGDSLIVNTSIYPIPSICAQVTNKTYFCLPYTIDSTQC